MSQWLKVLIAKPGGLRLIPITHVKVEADANYTKLSDHHTYCAIHASPACTHTIKIIN